ncbi:MAG: DUF3382 domain-containing protein, partial [Rhodospirillales bacterium]|nr:DUF3382 domain-containing protein [Rhodospirillales bacterium]
MSTAIASSQPPLAAMAKDAAAAALLAGLLAIPLLGIRLVDNVRGLQLDSRVPWVLWAMAIVFAGRLAMRFLGTALAGPQGQGALKGLSRAGASVAPYGKYLAWGLMAVAVILPFTPFSDRNLMDKATLVLIYVMLGWGLNIVVGLAGLLDLGYVAFYAVGAYTYALLS